MGLVLLLSLMMSGHALVPPESKKQPLWPHGGWRSMGGRRLCLAAEVALPVSHPRSAWGAGLPEVMSGCHSHPAWPAGPSLTGTWKVPSPLERRPPQATWR